MVPLATGHEWTICPKLSEDGVVEYIVDTVDQDEGVKPRYAHVMLTGRKAVDVNDEGIMSEIMQRTGVAKRFCAFQ